jgi:large subunit ribosomal protein L21
MYAVVTTGGKQYRVEAGSELVVERLAAEPGSSITFDRVLLVGDGEAVTVGAPVVDGASVSGTVLGEALGPKLVVFKFKQKVKYRRHTGHRQHLTRVRIDEITVGGTKAKAAAKASDAKADAADADEKPKRTRKAAAKADAETGAATETEKPKRTRKAAPKAESEE